MYEKKHLQQTNTYKKQTNQEAEVKTVYWGEVITIVDTTDGGKIKVRIHDLDNQITNKNLVNCYPLMPKFLHVYPKVGEVVRIILEDLKFPQRGRYWIGSVISQPQKINFDNIYTALSTTHQAVSAPETAPSSIPEAIGVYPELKDVALLGRENTDIILRERDIEFRAGQHELENNLKLNKLNPASVRLTFDITTGNSETVSSNVMMADRIALISHDGIPKFKSNQLNAADRDKIFSEAHPLGRGDVIVDALEILRKAIIQHVHPYSGMPVDKSGIVIDLEKIDFTQLLQNNIVIN